MIKIDSREDSKVFNLFEKLEIEYEKEMLSVGDIVCNDKSVCIERKTIKDFVNSIKKNHLQEQLANMQENFENNYLIISGGLKELAFSPIQWTVEQHLGSLASLAVRYNVKILQVDNDTQLVKLAKKIIDKTNDGKSPTGYIKRIKYTEDNIHINMLRAIPGIGLKKASKFLEKEEIKNKIKEVIDLIK